MEDISIFIKIRTARKLFWQNDILLLFVAWKKLVVTPTVSFPVARIQKPLKVVGDTRSMS